MPSPLSVPVIAWDGENWGALNYFGKNHIFCAEECRLKKENYSFCGGHKVRLYAIKNNVHWQIPRGINLDISPVTPAQPPRRKPNR